ncbi:MAG: glucosamine-6-phosphate deaminase [Kiritimatiellia bacterium]
MKIAIVQNPEEGSKLAASIFIDQVKQNPQTVLGLATGSTPVKMYKLLIEACKVGTVSFKCCKSFNLDEYLGLAPDHEQSYHYFMKTQLFDGIDIDQKNTHVPNGLGKDIAKSCAEYEAAIKAAGGVDIQLLGIGSDGHIAFNEPGCSLACRTHSQVLTQQTINDNARLFFGGNIKDVPTQAVTMGIGSIMDAKKVVLLAFGKGKQDAIVGLVEGSITAMCPCSALQYHNDCIVICDEDAAGKLKNKDYYKYIFSQTGVSNI